MIRNVKYAKYYIDNELTGKIIKIDEGFTVITGYRLEDVNERNMCIFDLVPEMYREDYVNALYSFREKGEAYINHQILCKNGQIISVNCYGEIYIDTLTKHECTKVLIIDVTEQEEAIIKLNENEEKLALQIEKFNFLIENINEIFVDYDITKDYIELSRFVNGKYEIFYSKENYLDSVSPTLSNEDYKVLKKIIKEDILQFDKYMVDFRSKLFTGKYTWYRLSYARFTNPKTGRKYIIGKLTDVNEEKLSSSHKRKEVEYDKLTGLYSATAMENEVDEIFAVSKDKKCTMLIVDVDNMSYINECYGCETGDKLLDRISTALCDMFRQDFDIVGRVYGDVFAVFIRNTIDIMYVEERCREICKKVSEDISDTIFYDGYRATVSIGIAVAGKNIDSYKRIYKAADKAMQTQKENGKNGFSI
ncbi:MAG: GGDEF domain-containing protein [Lachnospiraceae bacterium]|nr:GGDEF domain-containing protein [Lachnospiraceae bacterium]